MIQSHHGAVRWNLDDIHAINMTELIFLSQGGTRHTRKFFIHPKIVLEGDGCQGLGFFLNLNPFLGFNRLMQPLGISTSLHQSAGEIIDYNDFPFLDDIILIPKHQIIGAQRLINPMLKLHMLQIRKIIHTKIFFGLVHPFFSQGDGLALFIGNKIGFFFYEFAIQSLLDPPHLVGIFFSSLQGFDKKIRDLIQGGRSVSLSRYNQRRSRLINQNTIYLINDGIVKRALHTPFFKNGHIIP